MNWSGPYGLYVGAAYVVALAAIGIEVGLLWRRWK